MLLFQHGREKWKTHYQWLLQNQPVSPLYLPSVTWLCVLVGTMPATARRRDHQTGRQLASWETPAALSPDQFDWPPEARLIGSTVSAHPTFLPVPVIIYILIGFCRWWLLIFIKVKAANIWRKTGGERERRNQRRWWWRRTEGTQIETLAQRLKGQVQLDEWS